MSALIPSVHVLGDEFAKLPAFLRRDVLTLLSYRFAVLSDLGNVAVQLVTFGFIGQLVPPQAISSSPGGDAGYVAFVVTGIALGSFMQVSLTRVVTAVRTEQVQGTLESVLLTPTAPTTFLLGSVFYDLLYVPFRTVLLVGMAAMAFDVPFQLSGLGPAVVIIAAFVPVVWGLGVVSAAGVLTFRRGGGVVGILGTGLVVASGTYFPVDLLPGPLAATAAFNPVAVSLDALREVLVAGAGWEVLPRVLGILAPALVVTLALGQGAFRLALARERRAGTLGIY